MSDFLRELPIDFGMLKKHLQGGAIIAYPTEGVWGLGCDPSNKAAALKILTLKQRPIEKGMILVADKVERIASYVKDLPREEQLLSKNAKGKAITWVIEHGGKAPEWISGGRASIAVRMTQHPVVSRLCRTAEMPLISTSANPSSLPSATTEQQVREYFSKGVDIVVPGKLGGQNGASEIRDFATGKILREA